ncbi:DEAD-box helicase 25 [Phyllostomus discolor]|uniref:DEAD-box helicase 25 n=1 Tax=Phyllostomus discolor TaxID=89673 RepID=A0A834DF61_9CHIR|nr:DEAD-box helicase 25 [Phyllostomus discolor]
MGFNRPSKIQEMALPMMLAHPPQNLIAQSQSGTGKTAAFVLAMLSRVNALDLFPQCLCLAPTYELALQTGRVVEQMGRFCVDVQVMYAVRGNPIPRSTDLTKQIIIGTPGTVLHWFFKRKLFDLTKIRVFVLDEADVMIDTQGFSDQSIRIQRIIWPLVTKETADSFHLPSLPLELCRDIPETPYSLLRPSQGTWRI